MSPVPDSSVQISQSLCVLSSICPPNRVAQIPGAIEVLQVAGFRFSLEGEEGYLIINQAPPNLPIATRVVHQRLAHTLEQTN